MDLRVAFSSPPDLALHFDDTVPPRSRALRSATAGSLSRLTFVARGLREALAIRQVELAAKIDVSHNRIWHIEHGDIEKSQVDTLRKYVEAVGRTLRLEVEIGDTRFTLA